ncbi:extracellular solute-binding protein [Aquiluna sp. KACHI24]|uniref:sugar ABC transporter substrate-binding protein n=1 Tax=Aquiluna sp. KACHI24 TaxID=2968831 RepID=UPI002206B829|nr:extracellular solute-binding protein [Aquiluna sp. KACHI24]BDQ00840.1 maltose ABC transporter substrate-binding protein [Aquiluna sp. KACHI24]
MRKSTATKLALLSVSILALAGCSQADAPVQSQTAAATDGAAMTIWVDAELKDVANTLAEQYAQDVGGTLNVVEKDFYQVEAELASGAPDIFIGSTEWTDRLAQAGSLVSLGEPNRSGFEPRVLQGASYQGQLYGIPYAIESLALVCNGDELKSQPGSLSELTDAGYNVIVTPGGDPYTMFPIQSSFEAYPLELDESGDWVESSGLGASRSKEFAAWLGENKNLFIALDYSAGIAAFVDGQETCLLTGPWALSEILNRANFKVSVYDFPSVGGAQPLSFATSRAVFVSATSQNQDQAKKVAEYFSNSATQLLIYKQTGRVPAKAEVISSIEDPVIAGFAKAAAWSVVLPSSPLMQNTWAPWSKTLNTILTSDEDPQITWDLMVQDLAKVSG